MQTYSNAKRPRFSRWMPPLAAPPVSVWQRSCSWLLLAPVLAYAASAYVRFPPLLAVIPMVALWLWLLDVEQVRLARTRATEDIGTFARGFDRRSPQFDPWVIRATWAAFAPHAALPKRRDLPPTLPLRPSDSLDVDLEIEPLDIEEIVVEIAHRAGRSFERTEDNPYYGRIDTVGDVVWFVAHQPMATAA